MNSEQQKQQNKQTAACKISIIIPVLNEQSNLSQLSTFLQSVQQQGHEVIIVDGGSHDNSLMISHQITPQVIISKRGRARQMNNGAAIADGDVLLFLHADTFLPAEALSSITSLFREKHSQPKNLWGRFDVRLSNKRFVYRIIETMMNLRSCASSIATGDQAIFIEKNLFRFVQGYPEIALMEDIAISQQLKKIAKASCLKPKVITSSRRWETNGVVKTVLLMWRLRLYYYLGVAPDKLKRLYY